MSLIIRWLVGAAAVWVTVELGRALGIGLGWRGFLGALLFVLVLAILNAFIRPIVKLFTLPLNCMTFGLFALVVNAVMFWLAASLTSGIKVPGFWAALFGSVVLSILSGIISGLIAPKSGR